MLLLTLVNIAVSFPLIAEALFNWKDKSIDVDVTLASINSICAVVFTVPPLPLPPVPSLPFSFSLVLFVPFSLFSSGIFVPFFEVLYGNLW